jgi:hypothetical protein
MPRIYIGAPASPLEFMLRAKQGPPLAQHNFDLSLCAQGRDHVFKMNDDAVNKLLSGARQADDVLAVLYHLEACSVLPIEAANRLGTTLYSVSAHLY